MGLGKPLWRTFAGGGTSGESDRVLGRSSESAKKGELLMAALIVVSCAICVAAGVSVAVMIVREFPRLRNR